VITHFDTVLPCYGQTKITIIDDPAACNLTNGANFMRILTLLATAGVLILATAALAQTPTPDEYATEQAAHGRCGSDPVVWANLETKVWHVPGDKYYGNTKHGAYMCRTIASTHGLHAAK
jgi:hypothetical protein